MGYISESNFQSESEFHTFCFNTEVEEYELFRFISRFGFEILMNG